jgi:hypothetical protein
MRSCLMISPAFVLRGKMKTGASSVFIEGFKTPTRRKCGRSGSERHPFQPTPWP